MRLFVALDLDEGIRKRIHEFMEQVCPLAPSVRWVSAESLHVTLKFIGEQPDSEAHEIEAALARVSEVAFPVSFTGSGFFPAAKPARVFWVGIEAGPELGKLAEKIEQALAPLGVPAEKRGFNPHLTLARAGGGSGAPGRQRGDKPNPTFLRVRQHLSQSAKLEFGSMLAREFFLYRSQLSSQGSRYTKLAHFPLDVKRA